jgi:hypothetical protein
MPIFDMAIFDSTIFDCGAETGTLLDDIIGEFEKMDSENFCVSGFGVPGFFDECRTLTGATEEYEK